MNPKYPLVTVALCTFNDAEYIESSINSILDQTYKNLQIIIVNDGSTDGTANIIKNIHDDRINFIDRENKGKAASLNQILEIAEGKYLVIQDGDDLSKFNRIEVLVNNMESNTCTAMMLSGYDLIIGNKIFAPRGQYKSPETCKELIRQLRNPELDPTMIVKLDLAKFYKFNPEYKIGQCLDFIFRVGEEHPILVLEDILYSYRFNLNSNTKSNHTKKEEYLLRIFNSAKERRKEKHITPSELNAKLGSRRRSKDNNLSGHFSESIFQQIQKGNRIKTFSLCWFAVKNINLNRNFVKSIVYPFLPLKLIVFLKSSLGEK